MKILIFILSLFIFSSPLLAQDSSPSATPSSTSIEEIQKIRQAVQEKVQEKLSGLVSVFSDKKAFIGQITQKDEVNIELSYQGSIKKLTIDPETVVIGKNKSKSNIDELEVGQEILAMGSLSQSQTLETKRIVVVDLNTLQPEYQLISGLVVDVSQTTPTLSLSSFADKDSQYQINYTTKTVLVGIDGKKRTSTQILPSQRVSVLGTIDKKNSKIISATKLIFLDPPVTPTPTAEPTKAD